MNVIWIDIFWQLGNLTISLITATAFACASWLHFDAWRHRKNKPTLLRSLGFVLLAVSFLLSASEIESQLLVSQTSGWHTLFMTTLTTLGYIVLFASLVLDPLQPKPGEKLSKRTFILSPFLMLQQLLVPIVIFATAVMFRRKALVGLEKHVSPLWRVFMLLGVAELLTAARSLSSFTVLNTALFASFGPVWITKQLIQLAAALFLFKWCFSYLLKQFTAQLMILFSGAILFLFLSVSASYTTLLVTQLTRTARLQMTQAARLFTTVLDQKAQTAVSLAELIALDTRLTLQTAKPDDVQQVISQYSLEKKRTVWLTDKRGIVLAASDTLTKPDPAIINRAISLSKATSIVVGETTFGKQLSLQSAVPIMRNGQLTGVAATEVILDTPFLDELKNQSGFELTVYAQDEIAATTITASDGVTRPIGQTETKKHVLLDVLANGQSVQTITTIAGREYILAYTPLFSSSGNLIGMMSVGTPAFVTYQAVGKTIEQTLILATLLMLLSLIPSWLLSGYIAKQVR